MVVFFNDTATTEIYTLSLHDALPILLDGLAFLVDKSLIRRIDSSVSILKLKPKIQNPQEPRFGMLETIREYALDRKSTRLNSSHANISYAVFCLKKKYRLLLISSNIA